MLLLVFSLWSGLGYEMTDCGVNTYDSGLGVCEDCLDGLGITCKQCNTQDVCSTCKPGYMQYKNAANWTICVDCDLKFGQNCVECNTKNCTKCDGNYFLNDGGCYDCVV